MNQYKFLYFKPIVISHPGEKSTKLTRIEPGVAQLSAAHGPSQKFEHPESS